MGGYCADNNRKTQLKLYNWPSSEGDISKDMSTCSFSIHYFASSFMKEETVVAEGGAVVSLFMSSQMEHLFLYQKMPLKRFLLQVKGTHSEVFTVPVYYWGFAFIAYFDLLVLHY